MSAFLSKIKTRKEVYGAKEIMAKAKGVLVLPRVYKAGIGLGGEYGVGALSGSITRH